MKKSLIKKLSSKAIKNLHTIKGGNNDDDEVVVPEPRDDKKRRRCQR